jgi:hypothetical protein
MKNRSTIATRRIRIAPVNEMVCIAMGGSLAAIGITVPSIQFKAGYAVLDPLEAACQQGSSLAGATQQWGFRRTRPAHAGAVRSPPKDDWRRAEGGRVMQRDDGPEGTDGQSLE